MLRSFWKAALILAAVYAAAVWIGVAGGVPFALFAVPVLQITCMLFGAIRVFQLRRAGGHRPDAPPSDRESYGFALGCSISSLASLLALVVLSQVV